MKLSSEIRQMYLDFAVILGDYIYAQNILNR